jgi:hypothetical protein
MRFAVAVPGDGSIIDYYVRTASHPPERIRHSGFPKGDATAASAANAFLKRVLGAGESVMPEEADGLDNLDSTAYCFSGTILFNGLPSP